MISILVFTKPNDKHIRRAVDIANSRLKRAGFQTRVKYYLERSQPDWDRAVQLHDIKRLPTVLYRMDAEERIRLEGSYTAAAYFWKALSFLKPYVYPHRRYKKRSWERMKGLGELHADTKKRRKTK